MKIPLLTGTKRWIHFKLGDDEWKMIELAHNALEASDQFIVRLF